MMGIHDIGVKVHGSTHPMNVINGFIKALSLQRTPADVARDSGMKIVDVLKVYADGHYHIKS